MRASLTAPPVVALVLGLLLLAAGPPARAATLTWWATGSTGAAGGTGTWNTSDFDWTSDGVTWSAWNNATIDTGVFAGTAGTVTLGTGITIGGLSFTTTGYTITGNTLTLAGGTAAISVDTGISATIGSLFSGTAVFQKMGAGTLTLNNSTGNGSSLSGGIDVSGGTLRLAGSGIGFNTGFFTGSQAFTVRSGATLDLAGTWNTASSNVITIDGGTLSVTNGTAADGINYINTLNLTNGATVSGNAIRTGYFGSSTISSTSSVTNTFSAGLILVNGGANTTTFAVGSGTLAMSGGISDLSGLAGSPVVKSGAGTLVMTGTATYSGATTVSGGTLQLGSSGSTGSISGNISVSSGATLAFNRSDAPTYAGTISGAGSVTKLATGTLTLSVANTYSGGTLLAAGVLTLGNDAALGTGTLTFAGGAIRPTANRVVSNAIVAAASTSSNLIDAGAGDLMYAGTGTGSGTLVANSTVSRSMWLQGDWSGFTGTIQVVVNQDGTNYRLGGQPGTTLQSSGTNASNFSQTKFVLSGAGSNRGLSWNGLEGATVEVGELSGSGGRIIANGRTAIWQVGALNTSSTAAVVIEGATTAFTKVGSGTLTLTGASSYGGTTTVNAGMLRLGNRNALGSYIAGRPVTQVIVNAGGAIDFNGVGDATYGYTISGSGAAGAGAIVNNGSAIGNGSAQMSNLRLAADAAIGGTGNFGLLTNGFGATSLDLNGKTLTKVGSNNFYLTNTTVTAGTGGAIRVSSGVFSLDAGGGGTGWSAAGANLSGVAFSLANVSGAGLVLNNIALSLGSLAGGGATGGNVTLGSGTLTVGGLGTSTTYSGAIGGTGGLVKTGSGTLTLDRASGFTGPVTVNSGTLKVGAIGAFGPENTAVTKVIVNTGGAVDLAGINDVAYGYTISGSGANGAGAIVNTGGGIGTGIKQTSNIRLAADAAIGGSGNWALLTGGYAATSLDLAGFTLTKTGGNTISLVNTTATSGTIRIAAGTLSQAQRDNNLAGVAFTLDDATGATLALNDRSMTIGSLAGGGSTGGSVSLGGNTLTTGGLNANTTYSGAIGGSGSLIKVGTGTMALGGTSGYSGSTTIRAGALVANANAPSAAAGAFGDTSGAIVVGDGSTGAADAPSLLVGGAFTVGRAVSIGSVSNGNAYTAILGGTNASGTGTFSGAITLATTASSYTGVELRAAAGGTVDFTGAWTTADKPFTVGSVGNTGTIRLSSALATTAGVTVNAGTLQVGATTALGSTTPVTLGAATTLDMNGLAATIGTLAGSGTIAGGGGSVLTVTQATSGSFTGVVTGNVGLTKAGAAQLTLAGVSTSTGPITVSSGTLGLAGDASIVSSTVTVANAAGLTGSGTAGATTVLAGGSLAPGTAGAGTLTLTSLTFGTAAGNTATVSIPTNGLTSIPATMQVNGDVVTNGGAGTVTFAFGSLSLVPTGTYALIAYTGSLASGTAPFAYTGSTSGRQGVSFENGAGALSLVIANAFPIWSGTDGSGWSTPDNWKLNTDDAPTTFLANDTVVFNDSGVTGTVTISGSDVSPVTTTFSGDTLAYTLDSTGGFGIATGNLIKSGSAMVTIANTNSYTGGSLISGGSLVLTGSGGLGSGTVTVAGGSLVLTSAGGLGSGAVTVSGGRFAVTGAGALAANAISMASGTIEVGSDTALGSGTLSLSGGVLSSDSATARTIGNLVAIGGNATLGSAVNTGALTLSGTFDLGAATRSLTTASDVTLSGPVVNGGITKAGVGILTITGSNAFSGGTTLSAGRIRVGNDAALGSGGITLTSGTLSSDSIAARTLANAVTVGGDVAIGDATNTGLVTFAGTVNLGGATRQVTTLSNATILGGVVSGGLAKAGAGVLTLSASNSYAGGTTLSAGTLRLGNNAALGTGTVTLDGGTLSSDSTTVRSISNRTTLGGNVALGDATNSGALTLSGSMNLGSSTRELAAASDVTISGVISGDTGVGLTKAGPGTLTLSAANTYVGTTTVAGGTVRIANALAFGPRQTGQPVTQVVVNPGGTVDFNGTVDPVYGYTISGSGADGTGALVNNGAAITDFIAQTSNIRLAGDAAVGGSSNWGLLTFAYAATSLDLNGFTLTKLGSNRISLTNTTIVNTGTIVVATGILALNGNANPGALTGAGATIALANEAGVLLELNNRNMTIGALSGGGASGGNVSLGSATLVVGGLNTNTTFAGVISGGGNLAKNGTGTFTLSGANTFSGGVSTNGGGVLEATTISDGTSSIGSGYVGIADSSTFRYTGSTSATTTRVLWIDTGVGSSVIDVQNAAATLTWNPGGGTRNKDFAKAGAGTLVLGTTGTISGPANVAVTGGVLDLSAVNTFAGTTTISSGTLRLSGSGQLGGGGYAGAISNAGSLVVATSANQVLSGLISGGGSIAKSGAGTLTLSNASNSFTGGATLSAGVLSFVSGGLGTTGAVSLGGGTLEWASGNTEDVSGRLALVNSTTTTLDVGANAVTLATGFGGGSSATVVKAGAGTLALTGSNGYAGGTRIDAGRLVFASGGLGDAGSVTLAAGTVLEWAAGNAQDVSARLVLPSSGGITLDSGANAVALATGLGGTSAVALTKAGAGTITLTASNGYTGGTTITGGTLAIVGSGRISGSSTVDLAGATAVFDVSGADGGRTIGLLTGVLGSRILLGGNSLTAGGPGSTTFDGVISGSGGFTKADADGDVTLTSVQQFTGPATIAAGYLVLTGANLLENAARIDVSEGAGLQATAAGLGVVDGQTLGGYGTIYGDVTFASGAILSPGGSVGGLDGDFGNATLTGGMTYLFEVNDATGAAGGPNGWDVFTTTGAITLAASGTSPILLDIASLAGAVSGSAANFSPTTNYAWKFLVAGAGNAITSSPTWFDIDATAFQNTVTGGFSVVRGDLLGPGFTAGTDNELYVVYAAIPEPGTLTLAGIGLAAVAFAVRRTRRRVTAAGRCPAGTENGRTRPRTPVR